MLTTADQTFFVVITKPDVYDATESYVPRVAHSRLADAENEARYLAENHPGREYFVVQAVSCAIAPHPAAELRSLR